MGGGEQGAGVGLGAEIAASPLPETSSHEFSTILFFCEYRLCFSHVSDCWKYRRYEYCLTWW